MKYVTEEQLQTFLRSTESEYNVCVPVRLGDGTRALGRLDEGPLALAGGTIPQKVTNVFFPQMQVVMNSGLDDACTPSNRDKPLCVVGFTAADVDSLAFIDTFYDSNYRDDIYFGLRDQAVVVCLSGLCGAQGEFLRIAGGKCDMEWISRGDDYVAAAYSDAGNALLETLEGGPVSEREWAELQSQSDALGTEDLDLLRKASELLHADKVPETFWEAIGDRCIACTSCNLACPTCTCFDVFDRLAGDTTERWRMWDSCQLDGFMREASGHNPMGRESIRTRRRIHHKLGADVMRWGQISCMLCGRCDDVCPTGIGIKAVCKEMVEKYG